MAFHSVPGVVVCSHALFAFRLSGCHPPDCVFAWKHLLDLLADTFFSICASLCYGLICRTKWSTSVSNVMLPPNILSAVFTGEDLLVASADKPFRFPATFTFVVRSFTVLDGIGKGLDPRFDISEIAAPYARGLLLEGNPQYAALAKDFKRRLGLQVRRTTHQTDKL